MFESNLSQPEFTRVSVEKMMAGSPDIPPLCRACPDYERQCIICGHGPVVDFYTVDGRFVDSSDMCGVWNAAIPAAGEPIAAFICLKTKGILSSVEGCLLSLEGAGDAAESSHSLLQTVTETSAFHHGRVTVSPCVLPIVSQSTSTGAFA